MIDKPMDVPTAFPVRKTKKQKQAFRDAVESYLKTIGYDCMIEKGQMGVRNIVIGNPETARYLVTAHYDTPAKLPFPNLITPCSFWPFLGWQIVITALIFVIALIPSLLLAFAGIDTADAVRVWPVSLYAILALMLVGPANRNNARGRFLDLSIIDSMLAWKYPVANTFTAWS